MIEVEHVTKRYGEKVAVEDLSFVVQPGDTIFATSTVSFHNVPLPMVAVISWQNSFDFPQLDLAYSTKALCGKDMVSAATSDQFTTTAMSTGKGGFETAEGDIKPTLTEVYPNPSSGLFRLYLSLDKPQDVVLNLMSAATSAVAGSVVIASPATTGSATT